MPDMAYRKLEPHDVREDLRHAAAAMAAQCRRELDLPAFRIRWLRVEPSTRKAYLANATALAEGRSGPYFVRKVDIRPVDPAGLMVVEGEYVVCLNADMTAAEVLLTTAHECRHVWQSAYDPNDAYMTSAGRQRQEEDAEAYAKAALQRYREAEGQAQKTIAETATPLSSGYAFRYTHARMRGYGRVV